MCVVGTGTTLALLKDPGAVAVVLGRIVDFGGFSEEIADVEDNDISTAGHTEFCPGTLINHTELTFNVAWEGAVMPDLGEMAQITMTFAVPTGMSAGATLTGTGWLKKTGFDGVANNERIMGEWALRFSGKTGAVGAVTHVAPLWTAAS